MISQLLTCRYSCLLFTYSFYIQYCVLYKQVQHFTAGEERISRELKVATENEARLQVIVQLNYHAWKQCEKFWVPHIIVAIYGSYVSSYIKSQKLQNYQYVYVYHSDLQIVT